MTLISGNCSRPISPALITTVLLTTCGVTVCLFDQTCCDSVAGQIVALVPSRAGSKNERVCTCLDYHRPRLAGTSINPRSQPLATMVKKTYAGNEDAKPPPTRL